MKTRKILNETAEEIRAKLAEVAERVKDEKMSADVKAMSISDLLGYEMNVRFNKFRDFVAEGSHTEEEIRAAMSPAKSAIGDFNDEMRNERLEQMSEMKAKEAVLDYLRTQCVSGYKITGNSEKGYECTVDEKVKLEATDFIDCIFKTERATIIDAVCILADNMAKYNFKNEEARITRKSLSTGYISLRERKGWNVPATKLSLSKLASQMDEICKLITCGVAPKMISTDVRYVMDGVFNVKDNADEAGVFIMRDEQTILRLVYRAIYTRYNKFAYSFQTQTRGVEKAPLTAGANKDMAESAKSEEFSGAKSAEGGEVTLGEPA